MAESITLQTSDNNIQQSDVLGRVSFAASNESNSADARLIGASVHAEAEGDFTEISNPTSLVFSTASSESATSKIKITSSGHFIPVSNKTYDIGSSSLKFRNLYGETNYADTLVLTSGSAPSPTTNSLYNLSGVLHYEDKAVALLPSGGLATQILQKVSDTSYDLEWINNFATEVRVYVKNTTGSALTKGQAVYINGAQGDHPTISLAVASGESSSSKTLGLLYQNLAINEFGYVVVEGTLNGVDTSAATSAGDAMWLSPSTPGGIVYGVANKPTAPNHMVFLGYVIVKQQNNGKMYIKVQNGFELGELHNVATNGTANGQFLQYNTASGLWIPSTSGNFTTLQLNGTTVSVSGHTHTSSDITNFNTSVSGLLPTITNSGDNRILTSTGSTVGINAESNLTFDGATLTATSGNFTHSLQINGTGVSLNGHTHTSSNITDFNSSVSGLLPVKNIIAGTNVTVSSVSGTYTINSSASGGGTTELDFTYPSTSGLPASGDATKLYIVTDSNRNYRWIDSTNKYVETGPVGGGDTSLWNLFLPPSSAAPTATAGNGQVTLSWTSPTVLSQTPITDYIIQYSSNSGSTWTTFSDGTSTATSGVVTGLTNGTSYVFRVAGVNAIGTGSYSSASSSVSPAAGDSLFGNVVLLLHSDSTVSDSSAYARTLTANGASVSTSTKKYGAGSLYINGGGQYVSVPGSNAFNMSGDFAIEFFVNLVSATSQQWFLGSPDNANGYIMAGFNLTGSGQLWLGRGGISWPVQFSGLSLQNNTWHHIAISRSGSTNRCYVDGTLVSTVTDSTSWVANPSSIWIGSQSGGTSLSGYIDEFRWTVGNNRGYTGSTISVPSSAYPEAVSGSDPFFSFTSLLLHSDGTGTSFTDFSSSPKTITANGNATQSATQSKWGGKSAYFDGTNSYLSFSSTGFSYSGDFVIEGWVYLTSLITYSTLIEGRTSASYQNYICGIYNVGGTYRLDFVTDGGAGARLTGSSTSISLNTWTHIAIVRSSNTLSCYVNGTKDATTVSYSNTLTPAASTLWIGRNVDGNYFPGYIDDFRVTVGTNRGYSGSTITVPTSAFPDA